MSEPQQNNGLTFCKGHILFDKGYAVDTFHCGKIPMISNSNFEKEIVKMSVDGESLELHRVNHGKLMVKSKVRVKDMHDLSIVYTPGVAAPSMEISGDAQKVWVYTNKGNTVLVVSDGSAVLGLGNIGSNAAIPVMEGKAVLFKEFANIDAFPICLNTHKPDEIVETIVRIAPVFGGINLEDIMAPECFFIEDRLKKLLDIPVFHDDQHGAAVVVTAGLMNALKIVGKRFEDIKIVSNGIGAAGTAIARMLMRCGVKNLVLCDKRGALSEDTPETALTETHHMMSRLTNPYREKGTLEDVIKGADVFIGTSVGNIVTEEMVSSMAKDAIVFAMANPTPEINPEKAKRMGARIVGTGRSDYPNQVNNCLGFPGIFRGALDVRASTINEEMKMSAARAIANSVPEDKLDEGHILPYPFEMNVVKNVAIAVAKAAVRTGVSRLKLSDAEIEKHIENNLGRNRK